VFTRAAAAVRRLPELKTKRVAVGAAGSGTLALATQLLAPNGVTSSTATFIHADPADTVRALVDGSVDAALFVASPDAPFVRRVLAEPGIELLDLERTPALARRFPFLTPATLSQGVIDLERDIPARDTRLVATAASLAARNDLNASLIPALLNAVIRVHEAEDLLESSREFPSAEATDLPMNEDAARYIQDGPSFLYRWLPYTTAVLLDRLKVLALPFVALLLPLFKIGPPLYQWRVRSRIYRWYADVRDLDARLLADPRGNRQAILHALRELEREVASISVPLAYTGELYHLRLHIHLLQERLSTEGLQVPGLPAAPSQASDEPGAYRLRHRR
jgi:hypothetical protein